MNGSKTILLRTVLTILFALFLIVSYGSCSSYTPEATPTVIPTVATATPPTTGQLDPIQLEVIGLADFLANFKYSDFFKQGDFSPWDRPWMLENILERRDWKAVVVYDADNFGAPRAWVLVELRKGGWWAIEPNVDPMHGMGIVVPRDDRRYYDWIDVTFETGDEFKQFLSLSHKPPFRGSG